MKGLIFAAGLGTRLYPLTADKPKALVEVVGKPLLWHAIDKLKTVGVTLIVVNVHHYSDLIKEYIESVDFGVEVVVSDESDLLLDTGGGLLKAEPLLKGDQDIVIYNVDVITDMDLKALVDTHIASSALATVVVRKRVSDRGFHFDNDMQLVGWSNSKTKESIVSRDSSSSVKLGFSGIHVVSPSIFDKIRESSFEGKFSITPLYLELAKDQVVSGYLNETGYWADLGKFDQLKGIESNLKEIGYV